jgi:hypothetical protein
MTPGKDEYPMLMRRDAAYSSFNIIFAHDAYLGIVKQQIEGHYGKFLRLTNASFVLTQLESNLYNYYRWRMASGIHFPLGWISLTLQTSLAELVFSERWSRIRLW